MSRTVPILLVLAAGCGGGAAEPPDAGAFSLVCEDDPVTATIGPAGGSLALCGGSVTVAPGALTEAVTFGIAPASAPDPEAPRALAGPPLRFTPDDQPLPGTVELAVPHGPGPSRFELFAVEAGELVGVEPCTIGDATLGQTVGRLGTFVATRDDYPYAANPETLGAGTVATTIGAETPSWTLPADGWAIDQAYGPNLGFTITLSRTTAAGFEEIRIDGYASADGADAGVQFVQWYQADLGLIWQLGTPANPGTTGALALTSIDGDHLQGQVTATLFSGADTVSFAATLDVTPEYWRYPIELACAGGG